MHFQLQEPFLSSPSYRQLFYVNYFIVIYFQPWNKYVIYILNVYDTKGFKILQKNKNDLNKNRWGKRDI